MLFRPHELEKINENKAFVKAIKTIPIPDKNATISVFGTSVNVNAILKKNIWDRSIYTVDTLCDMFLGMNIERQKKYLKKKRKTSMNVLWLILLFMGIGIALIIIILFLRSGGLGSIFGG